MDNLMKALIIDDEQHCIDTLRYDLETSCSDFVEVVGAASDIAMGGKMIKEKRPHLVLLDIELPKMSGLDLLEIVDLHQTKVVFCTAHAQYAAKAYKYKAEAYLLKPVDGEELLNALRKIYEEWKADSNNEILKGKLRLPDREGLEFIDHEEIIYCQSNNNYATVFLSNGQERVISKTLKYIEERLPASSFVRIHHSYLINLLHLKKYLRNDGGQIEMSDGTLLAVSKHYRTRIKTLLD